MRMNGIKDIQDMDDLLQDGIDILRETCLEAPEKFKSVMIDYEYPHVQRLYLDNLELGCRLSLHKILPKPFEAEPLWHSHPWKSGVYLVDGSYDHCLGTADKITSMSVISSGDSYFITDPNVWHSVNPGGLPVYSIMVNGKPEFADRSRPGHQAPRKLRELTIDERDEMIETFRRLL